MKRIIFTLTFWALSFVVAAQVNFHAPDVASLNKYIDFPVDKSTGTSSIQVPIHTIQAGSFNLPVSLAYHTGGIKVTEMASSVGLGWSLQAGGVISREIRSLPDEAGYYQYQGFEIGTVGPWSTSFVIGDSEPDIFSFSVNGLSGKFFFDKNRQVQLIPEQDISISIEGNSFYGTFGKFTITSADGTKYIFDGVYDTYNVYDNLSSPRFDPDLLPSAWHLTKIVTTAQEEVLFTYQEDGYQTRVNAKDPVSTSSNTGFCASCYTRPVIQQMHGNVLTSISSKTSQILFNYKSSVREDISPDYGLAKALDHGVKMTRQQRRDLRRGCIGVTVAELSNNGNPVNPPLNGAVATFAAAQSQALQLENDIRNNPQNYPSGSRVVIFSKRFWSSDPSKFQPDANGNVDMTGYDYSPRPGYVNFDYGLYDARTNTWWHANHCANCGMGKMKVYQSDINYYSQPLLDFNRQVFIVTTTTLPAPK